MGSSNRGSKTVFILDEIGKMELFSQSFIRSVKQTLDNSSCTILGTIPLPKGKPLGLIEEVRSRTDVKVFIVSTNMNTILGGGVFGSVYVSWLLQGNVCTESTYSYCDSQG